MLKEAREVMAATQGPVAQPLPGLLGMEAKRVRWRHPEEISQGTGSMPCKTGHRGSNQLLWG